VEQFRANGKPLENFVASGCVLYDLQLRGIMPICALLQRMGIFRREREKFRAKRDFQRHRKIGSYFAAIGPDP
jgi:hypothetical protein